MKAYNNNQASRGLWILLGVGLLVLAALACTFDFNAVEPPPDETEISRSVEETLQAEQSLTEQARPDEEGGATPTEEIVGPNINATIQAQQATLDAQATSLAQPSSTSAPSPVAEASPTVEAPPPASVEPISLTEMKSSSLRQAPGCGEDRNGPPCWFGSGEGLEMTTQKPLLIDPAWDNPHLVFSHRYVMDQNATIYVKADGGWEVLWSFPSGQSSVWVPFKVDLGEYKGKQVLLQFSLFGCSGICTNEWYIRDPKIVPNYQP
jgi:hypothetical protein